MMTGTELRLTFEDNDGAALATTIAEIKDMPEVVEIRPVVMIAEEEGRSAEAIDFSRVLLELAPGAIKAVLGMIVPLVSRYGAPPAKINIKTKAGEVDLEFDGKGVTPEIMSRMVSEVLAKLGELDHAPSSA